MKINLSKIADVNRFNAVAMRLPCDIDLKSGKYKVDGKSIMGTFSLDLAKPVDVIIDTDDDTIIERFKNELADIISD